MNALATVILVLLLLSPFALIIFFAVRYQRKMLERSWVNIQDIFAENRIRLTSVVPEKTRVIPDIHGETEEFKIRVYSYYVGTGKSRTLITSTLFELKKINLPSFTLGRENIFTRAGEVLGIKDIKTGNEEFDKTFRLKSNSESETLRLFKDQLIGQFNSEKKGFYGKIESSGKQLVMNYYGMPGFKIGLKHYRLLFKVSLAILSACAKNKGNSPLN